MLVCNERKAMKMKHESARGKCRKIQMPWRLVEKFGAWVVAVDLDQGEVGRNV